MVSPAEEQLLASLLEKSQSASTSGDKNQTDKNSTLNASNVGKIEIQQMLLEGNLQMDSIFDLQQQQQSNNKV